MGTLWKKGMKLDGVNMETTEPTEAVAEPSTQENASEQASPQPEDTANDAESNGLASVSPLCRDGTKVDAIDMRATEPSDGVAKPSTTQENQSERAAPPQEDANAAPAVNPKANGRPVAAVEPKCISKKPTIKSAASSGTNTRAAGAATSQRPVNDVRAPNNASTLAVRKTGANAKSSAAGAGAVPKRPAGAAVASSSVRSQTRVPDKRPVGQARTTSATNAAADGTKHTSANGTARKRTGPEVGVVGGARPKNPGKSSEVMSDSENIYAKVFFFSFCCLFSPFHVFSRYHQTFDVYCRQTPYINRAATWCRRRSEDLQVGAALTNNCGR